MNVDRIRYETTILLVPGLRGLERVFRSQPTENILGHDHDFLVSLRYIRRHRPSIILHGDVMWGNAVVASSFDDDVMCVVVEMMTQETQLSHKDRLLQ